MLQSVKNQGKININELSQKQVITLVTMWAIPAIKKQVPSFTAMLDRCYKSSPWHENAPILYINTDEKTVTTFTHAFYDMTESEENTITQALNR